MFVIGTLVSQAHSLTSHFLFVRFAMTFATVVCEFLFGRRRNRVTVFGSFYCCQNESCSIGSGDVLKIDEDCRRIALFADSDSKSRCK